MSDIKINVRIQPLCKSFLTDTDRHHTGTRSVSPYRTDRISHLGVQLISKGTNVKVLT